MTVSEFIRRRLLWCERQRTEWSDRFEMLMRNRLVIGSLRYGRMHDKKRTERYDHISAIMKAAERYRKTGNQEELVDIANLAMLEFVRPSHPSPCWSPTDDQQHVETIA